MNKFLFLMFFLLVNIGIYAQDFTIVNATTTEVSLDFFEELTPQNPRNSNSIHKVTIASGESIEISLSYTIDNSPKILFISAIGQGDDYESAASLDIISFDPNAENPVIQLAESWIYPGPFICIKAYLVQ